MTGRAGAQRLARALCLVGIASLGLAGCTSAIDGPESVPPSEQAPDEAVAPAPWPAVKLTRIEHRAPPPALPGAAVARDELSPPVIRFRVDPAGVGVMPPRALVGLYAEVDGRWREVGVGEPLDAGSVVVPVWLDVRRYGAALEARPLVPGTPAGAAVAQVVVGGGVGAPVINVGEAQGVRVGDLYEAAPTRPGEAPALLKITAVEKERARVSIESGEVIGGAWVRQLERLPVVRPAWIEGAPLDAGARRWLAGLITEQGPDGALIELRRRVALGVAEDRLALVSTLTAYRRWGEADALVREAIAAARDAGERPAELAALLIGARLDLEIGDDDGAADRLAEARDLGPTGASLAALERLEAELRYHRWDLKGAATILEERALPALAGSDDPQAEAAVQATLAEIERHQGAFDRAAKRIREQVLPRLTDDDDRAQRARALDLLAEIEVMRGPPGPALAVRRDQELPLYAALGDRWGEGRAYRRIADYELARGKNGAAEAAYKAAKEAAQASGDPREALRLERWYGEFIYVRSDFRGALEREAAVVRGYARLGDPQGYAMHLASRAEIAAMLGDLGESMRVVKREALPLAEAIGDDFARLSVRATQAALYSDRGMPREALKIRRDELLPHYRRMANPRDEAFTHVFIADSLMDLGDLDEAERRITRGQRTLKALGELRLGALCLDRLSRVHELRGDFPGAARLNVEERAVYERIGDALGVATVDHQRSNQLMRQGDYDGAMRLLEETVMPELRRLGALAYWASAATDLGAAYSERGDFDRALTIFSDQALPAYESIGDRRSTADVQAQIGDIHYARGDCEAAAEIYKEAVLPAYTAAGDVRGRASTLSRIAACHVDTGKSTEALALYRQALEIYESLGDAYSAAVMYGEIGTVYEALGKYGPALELYRERVLPVYEPSGDRIAVAVAKSRMADLHFALGDMDRAIAIREAENEVFRAAGSDYYLMGSRWMLAIYLDRRAKAGDRDRARELADQALAVAIRLGVPEEAMIRAFIQSMRP